MKDIIKLHDRKFKIMIPAEKIDGLCRLLPSA